MDGEERLASTWSPCFPTATLEAIHVKYHKTSDRLLKPQKCCPRASNRQTGVLILCFVLYLVDHICLYWSSRLDKLKSDYQLGREHGGSGMPSLASHAGIRLPLSTILDILLTTLEYSIRIRYPWIHSYQEFQGLLQTQLFKQIPFCYHSS